MRELLQQLRDALQFYADQDHFVVSDSEAWDTVSGEPPNFWSDEQGTAMVEDGSVAEAALAAADAELEKLEPKPKPDFWIAPDGEGFRLRMKPPENKLPLDWDALYLDPPSESEAVALLGEIVSRFDAAYPIPLVVDMQLKNKIDAILKGKP